MLWSPRLTWEDTSRGPPGKGGPRHADWEMAEAYLGGERESPPSASSGHRLQCNFSHDLTLPGTNDSCFVLALLVYFDFCYCYCKTFKVLDHGWFL